MTKDSKNKAVTVPPRIGPMLIAESPWLPSTVILPMLLRTFWTSISVLGWLKLLHPYKFFALTLYWMNVKASLDGLTDPLHSSSYLSSISDIFQLLWESEYRRVQLWADSRFLATLLCLVWKMCQKYLEGSTGFDLAKLYSRGWFP